jgi:hypothetical protein
MYTKLEHTRRLVGRAVGIALNEDNHRVVEGDSLLLIVPMLNHRVVEGDSLLLIVPMLPSSASVPCAATFANNPIRSVIHSTGHVVIMTGLLPVSCDSSTA